MLKANICTSCNKLINKHSPEAIPDNQCLLKVGWVCPLKPVEFCQWVDRGMDLPKSRLPPEEKGTVTNVLKSRPPR